MATDQVSSLAQLVAEIAARGPRRPPMHEAQGSDPDRPRTATPRHQRPAPALDHDG